MAVGDTAKLIASLELQDKFSGPARNAERALDRLDGRTSRLGAIGGEVNRGLKNTAQNVAAVGVVAGAALTALVAQSVRDASALEQTSGAIESVFGKLSGRIEAFADTAAESTGLSRREVQEMAAVVGAQLQGMGFAVDDAADKTIELEKRAADLAATFGGTTSDAVRAISALLRGERDPIERYGVSIKAADVAARIAAKGLDTSTTAAKKNAEAVAGLELLLESTAKTQGQFARESNTFAGAQQRLAANLENTRAVVGTALLPQIAKLTQRLNEAITANLPAIEGFAAKLPAIFDKLLGIVERLPWESIGTSFKLMGQGAEALLTAFTSLPPWVQTAVLTGWGLNKLSGGALGNIAGMLGKGVLGGLRGQTPANPVFVADVGGGVGGGVPGAAGRAGGGLRGAINGGGVVGGLATGVAAASPLLAAGAAIEVVNFDNMRQEQRQGLQSILDELPRTPREIDESISRLEAQIAEERPLLDAIIFNTNVKPQLDAELAELRRIKSEQAANARMVADKHRAAVAAGTFSQINEFRRASNERRGEANRLQSRTAQVAQTVAAGRAATERGFAATTGRLDGANARLGNIERKNFSPTVRVSVTSSVSISEVQRKIISQQIAVGRGFLEGVE